MKIKFKKNNIQALLIIIACLVFVSGLMLRYKTKDDLKEIERLQIPGFVVLQIANVVKAGFWKIQFSPIKKEMIAKNSLSLFGKGGKNRKRYLDPSLSPNSHIVAYTLEFKGKKSVALMLSDGSKERQYIELEKVDIEKPEFSPDGKHVAVISAGKVYVTEFSKAKKIELQSITKKHVADKYLTWISTKHIGYIANDSNFYSVNIESAKAVKHFRADQAAVSSDLKKLAVALNNKIKIYSITAKKDGIKINNKPEKVLNYKINGKITWSPDSRYILATIENKTWFQSFYQIGVVDTASEEVYFMPKKWNKSLAHSWR